MDPDRHGICDNPDEWRGDGSDLLDLISTSITLIRHGIDYGLPWKNLDYLQENNPGYFLAGKARALKGLLEKVAAQYDRAQLMPLVGLFGSIAKLGYIIAGNTATATGHAQHHAGSA